MEIQPQGKVQIYLKKYKENYIIERNSTIEENMLIGNTKYEHFDVIKIKNYTSGDTATLNF